MKTRIHVNQHNIRANAKGADLPVLTVKTYKENVKCNRISLRGVIMAVELLHMDCMEYMKGLEDNAFELAIV